MHNRQKQEQKANSQSPTAKNYLWRLGGALAILAAILAVAGALLGLTTGGGVWSNEGAFPEAFLQAIVDQPALWTVYALLTTVAPPILLLVANGALFDYLGQNGGGAARAGLWLGAAGLALLLLLGALHYVAYPRLASAYVSDPATAFEVFRPLRLLDHALRRFGPLVGLGIPALLAAGVGGQGRRLPLLVALLGLVVFAAHAADLALNYQVLLLNAAALALTALWTLAYGAALFFARAEPSTRQADEKARAATADQRRQRRRPARPPGPAPADDDSPAPPDPYTALPEKEAGQEADAEADDDSRWRPPPRYREQDGR